MGVWLRPVCKGHLTAQVPRTAGALVLAVVALVGCGDAAGEGSTEQQLPIAETAAGYTVSLTAVAVSAEETLLTFRIEDAQADESPDAARYDGMIPKLDLELTGLPFSDGEFIGMMRPIRDAASTLQPQPIIGMEQDVVLGPPEDPSSPVTVVLKQLRISSDDPNVGEKLVEGPWTFTCTPSDAASDTPTTLDVNERASSDDVTFVVEQIELSGTESIVTYNLDSQRAGRLEETGLVARLPDGSVVTPTRIAIEDGRHIAHFAPFPSGSAVEFIVPAVLTEIHEAISVLIPIAVDDTGVAPVDAPTVLVDGDTLLVTEITPLPDAEQRGAGFSIRVENASPEKTGRVLLSMPGASATLVDNLGNVYERGGGGTNLEKSSLVEMWAGGSSFGFLGEIPAEATSLTLTTESYALVLGPWTVSVQLP